MARPIDQDKFPAPRHYVSLLVGVAAGVIVSLMIDVPTSPVRWLLLGLGSLAAAVALTLLIDALLGSLGHRWCPPTRRAVALPVVLALALAAAAVAVTPWGIPSEPELPPRACGHSVELRMLTSPDGLAAATTLASEYQRHTRTDQNCPTVNPYVYAFQPDRAIEALRDGWAGRDRRDVGPRPDVWIPDLPAQVETVREGVPGPGDLIGLDNGVDAVVGSSPLVVAVPASQLSEPEELRWAELPGLAEEQDWGLVRPDPAGSAIGELANAALYGSADTEEDRTGLARQAEPQIEQAMKADGYPLAGPDALLCRHREHIDDGTGSPIALIVTEQAMARHNRGDPLGAGCATATDTSEDQLPEGQLVALYPSDTVTVDQPVVPLTWRQQAPEHAQAAADFRAWLSEARAGRLALVKVGLRPPDQPIEDMSEDDTPLVEELGVQPDAVSADQTSQPPTDEALERGRSTYEDVQRPGRVLLAVDVSGSMAEPVGTDDTTRLDVAQDGVETATRLLGDRDELGLWVFPEAEGQDASPRPRELVRVDTGDHEHRQAVIEELADERPGGGTPLYRAIVDGVGAIDQDEDVTDEDESPVTALVVLTDGEDTEDNPDTDADLDAVGGEGVRVFVIAVGEASCRVDALAGVTARTGGECVEADFATLEDQLVRVFGLLWSGADND